MIWPTIHTALACGGLACAAGPGGPVVQTGERIAFAIQPDGFVEAHVQVFYEGPPDAFAWVIPIPAEPEVFLSSELLFERLDPVVAPRFTAEPVPVDCGSGGCRGTLDGAGVLPPFAVSDTGVPPEDGPAVRLTGAGEVGPYDYRVLDGTSGDAVVAYLQGEGFDLVDDLGDRLAPYVASGGRFLAVRLSKDEDTGDIAPLGFRYRGTEASVPLVLTAIASAPDLAVEVTVFGASRAIPTNYLHVVPEPAAIDWLANGANYFDVVARAVDEAGGQAFATDSAGPLGEVEPVWTAAHDGLRDRLLAAPDPAAWVDELVETGVVPGSDFDRVLRSHVVDGTWDDPLADELAPEALPALTEELVDRVIAPRERVQALFAAPYVTRLSTTIDPAEMTVDPQFALVEGLPDVPVERIVEIEAICDPGPGEPRMAVVLPDGRRLDDVPTMAVAARRIERLTRDGEVQVLVDNGRVETDPRAGASCSITPVRVGFVAALLGLGLVRRRATTKRS